MKPVIIFISTLFLIGEISSCSKSPATVYAGSWTFKGVTDTAVSTLVYTTSGNLSASTSSSANPTESITFTFATYPTASGTYSIISNGTTPTGTNVGVGLAYGTTNYWSTGNDHPTANVSVSSAGKVTVTIASVEVKSVLSADSAAVTNVSVTQQ